MLSLFLAIAIILIPTAVTQTPQGFTPSVSSNLGVAFAHNTQVVTPGIALLAAGILPLCLTFQNPEVSTHPRLFASTSHILPNNTYLALMIDLDVVHNGTAGPVLHWYQPNLQTIDPQTGELVAPDTPLIANSTANGIPYATPVPPPGETHRYVQLLFSQCPQFILPRCYDSIYPPTPAARSGFDLKRFMELTWLGEPIAANYFTLSIPALRTTLSAVSCAPTAAIMGC